MVQTEENKKMAMYILQILNSNPIISMSWGFNSALIIKNGLRFCVNGFCHKGLCEVVYVDGKDTFTFRTINKDGKISYEVEDVYVDNLVDVVDKAVETGSDNQKQYKNRVESWLNTL